MRRIALDAQGKPFVGFEVIHSHEAHVKKMAYFAASREAGLSEILVRDKAKEIEPHAKAQERFL